MIKRLVIPFVGWSILTLFGYGSMPGLAVAQSADSRLLRQLKEIIERQQGQIQHQQEQIRDQSKKIQQQGETLQSLQLQVEQLLEEADDMRSMATEARIKAEIVAVQADTDRPVVASGEERIKLAVSGQVNRMVNVADDGEKTKVYYVDNDHSSTRFRLVGTGRVTEDLTAGSEIEVELESNSSFEVNQEDEDTGGADINDRKLDVFFDSRKLGRLSIGKGHTASDGTAEVDLSGTAVIASSRVEATAGGLYFRDQDTGDVSDTRVKDVFFNFDGLSRRDRVRYDSPLFHGFILSGDAAEDQQWDVALRWSGQTAHIKVAGAVAVSDPSKTDVDRRYSGSFSIQRNDTGLNFTMAGGMDDQDDRDDARFWFLKGGWQTDRFFDFGITALSVDVSETYDLQREGDGATSFGAYAVQNISNYGLQIYGGMRYYDLDRSRIDFDEIWVGSIGTRLKF